MRPRSRLIGARRARGLALALAAGLGLALGLGPAPARAVFVLGDSPASPGQNTAAPTGALAGSGWQYEGLWQVGYVGTQIAPSYFITAAHVGGSVGETFVSAQGQTYTTTAYYDDPNGDDLRIWKVNGTFSTYAPLYGGSNEAGQAMTVFGRGGPGGAAVVAGGNTVGWTWTGGTTTLSWGTNVVTAAGTVNNPAAGLPASAQFLTFQFNPSLGPNTAALSTGDSGGGVFIEQNGVWALAGINYAADGPFNTEPVSSPSYNAADAFAASLFTTAPGVYDDGTNTLATTPTASYATRISSDLAWIESVINPVPEPRSLALLIAGVLLAAPLGLLKGRPPAG